MIITATTKEDAYTAREWLVEKGYVYRTSLYWSEEWKNDNHVVFLHKGYDTRGRTNYEWEGYTR